MSWALFQAGTRRQPRTAARRIAWMVVTLVPLGVIAVMFVTGAVANWIALGQGPPAPGDPVLVASVLVASDPAPELLDTWMLTAYGVVAVAGWIVVFVLGLQRVREQRESELRVRVRRELEEIARSGREAERAAGREKRASERAAHERRREGRRRRRP